MCVSLSVPVHVVGVCDDSFESVFVSVIMPTSLTAFVFLYLLLTLSRVLSLMQSLLTFCVCVNVRVPRFSVSCCLSVNVRLCVFVS